MSKTHAEGSSPRTSNARSSRGVAERPPPYGVSVVDAIQGDAGALAPPSVVQTAAAEGIRAPGGPLPFLPRIQASFGAHDVSRVVAHTGPTASAAARAMGASAFATGNHVAFAGAPSLHTAAHEAAHVVQQRAGVHLQGGVGRAGDMYEQQADEVADRVVAGRSAEDLLGDPTDAGAGAGVQRRVQRKLELTGVGNVGTAELREAAVLLAVARVRGEALSESEVDDVKGGLKLQEELSTDRTVNVTVDAEVKALDADLVLMARITGDTWWDDRTDKSMPEETDPMTVEHRKQVSSDMHKASNASRDRYKMRDEAAAKAIDAKLEAACAAQSTEKFPTVEHLQVGAGQAAVMNAQSLGDEMSQADGIPSHLCVAMGASLWEAPELRNVRIGQTPNELSGFKALRDGVDWFADTHPDDYARIGHVADAIAYTRAGSGMTTYAAEVVGVSAREETDERGTGKWRVQIRNAKFPAAFLYANQIDFTTGPGVPNLLTSQTTKSSAVDKATHDKLRARGIVVYATEQLAHPTTGKVLVYGGGASGAWACEVAAEKSDDVVWVARSGSRPNDATKENPDKLPDKRDDSGRNRLTNPDAIKLKDRIHALYGKASEPSTKQALEKVLHQVLAFGDAALARNTGPKGAFTLSAKVKRVVGDLKMENEGLIPTGDADAPTGVRAVLQTGKFPDNTTEREVSQVVVTLGFKSSNEGGTAHMLRTTQLVPVFSGKMVVALEGKDDPNLRILGAAAMDTVAFAQLVPEDGDLRKKYVDAVKAQSLEDPISAHSKSVAASFELAALTIPKANEARKLRKAQQ